MPADKKASHLPSLDGLRAISIIFVLLGHLNGTHGFGTHSWITICGDIGHFGVTVFFVISGFLITGLLIKEREKTGAVSLKLFYARRALRIFPASFMFLGVIGIASALGLVALAPHDLLFGFLYLVNYKLDRAWPIGHLWSLSVEEQFYLLWPFAFSTWGRRRGVWLSAGFVLLGPGARIVTWLLWRHSPYRDLETFPTVADSLASGCLLAVAQDWLESQRRYLSWLGPIPSAVLAAALLAINRFMDYTIVSVLGGTLINLGLAVLIHRSCYHCTDAWGRFLNSKPMAFVGLLSYSIYLWQQPFLNRYSDAWTAHFPANLVFTFAGALLSYFLLEKPFMKLRSRLRVVPA